MVNYVIMCELYYVIQYKHGYITNTHTHTHTHTYTHVDLDDPTHRYTRNTPVT